MITLAPINQFIQRTLKERISMLKKSSAGSITDGETPEYTGPKYAIGTPLTDDKGAPPENYMMTRTPFLRMTSFVPKEGTVLSPIVLMGGPLDSKGNLMGATRNYFETVHGAQRNFEMNESGQFKKGYGWNSPGLEHSRGNPNFRPRIPLVQDVNVEYAGGGMMHGAHRTADISWTCWTWEQLQEFTPHFLNHGNTVLLEWGWSGIGALQDVQLLDIFTPNSDSEVDGPFIFDTNKFNGNGMYGSVYEHLVEHTTRQQGNYDGMLGLITDFEYSVNDTGGFDCSTKLVASGVTMLGKKLSHDNNDKFSQLPALVKSGYVEKKKNWGDYYVDVWNWGTTETTDEVELKPATNRKEISELAPYITFKDYMDDLFNQAVYHFVPFLAYGEGDIVFDKDVPGGSPQILVTTFIKNYKTWTVAPGSNNGEKWNLSRSEEDINLVKNNVGTLKYNPSEQKFFKEKFENAVDNSGGVSGQVTTGTNKNGDDTFLIGRIVPTEESVGAPYVIADWNYEAPSEGDWANRLKTSLGAYVTWGWFEDNVLTRFYGDIHEASDGSGKSRVYNEIRSIDKLVNKNGEFVWWNDERDFHDKEQIAKPCYVPTKMVNSKYLITVDSSKWIIPNPNDPILSNLDFSVDWMAAESTNSSMNTGVEQTVDDRENGIGYAIAPSNLHKQGEWVKHYFDDENFQPSDELVIEDMADVARLAKSNKDEMCIRNILFNTEYLTKKFTNKDTIKKSIMDLWSDFSRTYGDVYKFVLDFDEDGNRLKVREEGYTAMKLEQLLEGSQKEKLGQKTDGFPPLFIFPTWEDGSIVKSQTLNAKIPDRMQQQAMYGNSTKKYGDQSMIQKSYSSLAAQAWGRLSSDPVKNNDTASEDEKKQQRYKDLISGKIDYPSRGNRSFGSDTADIQNTLYVGPTPPYNENLGIYEPDNNISEEYRGTVLSDSIKEQLTPEIKEYIEKRKAEMEGLDGEGHQINADDKLLESMLLSSAFERISATGDSFSATKWGSQFGKNSEGEGSDKDKGTVFVKSGDSNWSMFYSFRENKDLEHTIFYHHTETYTTEETGYWSGKTTIKTHETEETYDSAETNPIKVGHMEIKKELLHTLQNLLRGDPEGVLRKQRPLLPLELDIEIDGVGGIFPGNSFHSSYLPERYLEETVFQCMGASHKIDSSGWTTTLKGQIRNLPQKVGVEPTVEEIVEEEQKKIPPIQRTYPQPPSDDDVYIGDEVDVPELDMSDQDIIVADEPKNEWIELLSTFKGEVWQNMVIYGHRKTINSEGKNQWVQTGMHKPEWQPMWEYSDGSRHPFKSAQILQDLGNGQQGYRKEYGDMVISISSKTVRQTYWDQNIEAPNETGESVGYDMLNADTLSTIY